MTNPYPGGIARVAMEDLFSASARIASASSVMDDIDPAIRRRTRAHTHAMPVTTARAPPHWPLVWNTENID